MLRIIIDLALFLGSLLIVYSLTLAVRSSETPVAEADNDGSQLWETLKPIEHSARKSEMDSQSESSDVNPESPDDATANYFDTDRELLARSYVNLFDPGNLSFRAAVAEHYRLSDGQVRALNSELANLFIDLRALESSHSEVVSKPDGDTFLRIRPYPDARLRTSDFIEKVADIFGDQEVGRSFARLVASNSTIGMLGEMTEDVSIIQRQRSDGSMAYNVERIAILENEEVFHSTSTYLFDSSPVREAYEKLFPLSLDRN